MVRQQCVALNEKLAEELASLHLGLVAKEGPPRYHEAEHHGDDYSEECRDGFLA